MLSFETIKAAAQAVRKAKAMAAFSMYFATLPSSHDAIVALRTAREALDAAKEVFLLITREEKTRKIILVSSENEKTKDFFDGEGEKYYYNFKEGRMEVISPRGWIYISSPAIRRDVAKGVIRVTTNNSLFIVIDK